ncbi:MAG: MFS transporter [Pseudomonadota bacterium]
MADAPRAPGETAAPVFVSGFCNAAARPYLLVAAILASALGFIDGTVVSIALPAMRASLGADLAQAQWIHNAYMLTLSALILVGGAAGDRFGLARVFGIGIGVFLASSVVCAIAPSPSVMIGARTVQGIGAAIMVPGSLALIARAYPREERGWAIGIWAAASALTTALGPIVGGLALTLGGPEMWRWIFAVNLPLGGLALWLLWRNVDQDPKREGQRLDAPGAAVATAALLALAWSLTSEAWIWALAGGALLLAFLGIEARSPAPMMPLSLFRARAFSAANLLTFLLYGALNIMFFFMPMTFIAGWGYSEIAASATFAPMSVFIALLSARAGRFADRIGPAPLLAGGSLIVAAGYAAMAALAPFQNLWWHILPAMCLVGLGMSAVVAPLSATVIGAVEDAQTGVASGVNNAITRMAGLIFVAAVGPLIAARYAASGGQASFGVPSDTEGHAAAMTAAFGTIGWLSAALCLASALIAFLAIPRRA